MLASICGLAYKAELSEVASLEMTGLIAAMPILNLKQKRISSLKISTARFRQKINFTCKSFQVVILN